ncbi:MAG TPA: condensation domain-containing protein, partial [Thermoanaerobaculia bacterium]|nr:condensation domain-containing protein [Thermoanaerobaculia bacterium]
GVLEFLGRLDHQVKVRGFRIEPGEIEAALASHQAVREVVVVARDLPGGKALVAYVTADAAAVQAAELREFLRGRLPEPMVPSAFVFLDRWPLLPNGKIDRRALPVPNHGERAAGQAPRSELESAIAAVWMEVLQLGEVGVDDSFFDLGGHSLLLSRVRNRLRESLGHDLPLVDLFKHPTIASLAQHLGGEALAVTQGRLLLSAIGAPPIARAHRNAALPLSYAQESLWFLARLEPESPAYNIAVVLLFRGALDIAALGAALTAVVHRHEVLRTRFVDPAGGPIQIVEPPAGVPLPVVDLEPLASAAREEEVARWASAAAQRPFDLERGPLIRVLLLRLGVAEHRALLTVHHVVADGWSLLHVLPRELAALYRARGAAPLAPLPCQYSDYAVWQRRWLSAEALDEQAAYWRERLREAPPWLRLPTDLPRSGSRSPRAGEMPVALPAELTAALQALSRRQGATLFMTLTAAFQVLLGRWSGQDDVTIGTPVANRPRVELEGLIGMFVNTLALRTRLTGDPPFRELLSATRRDLMEAYTRQDLPFERLVEMLQPERSADCTPIFQILLSLQSIPSAPFDLPGVEVEALPITTGAAKFDMSLMLEEAAGGLRGVVTYTADLYDAATVERLLRGFGRLLAGVVQEPSERLSRLPLLTTEELAQLLVVWNSSRVDWPTNLPLVRRLRSIAERQPEETAVVWIAADGAERSVSYGDLERRAGLLGRELRAWGVGPERLVAVAVRRSPDLLVALLAVLEAGGAYLALEPRDPRERLAFVLADARPHLLVTDGTLRAEDLGQPDLAEFDLRGHRERPAAPGNRAPEVEVSPGNLAYVIYTSGSTGRPKGVMAHHGGLLNYLQWVERDLLTAAARSLPLLSPVAFDASLKQLFVPLLRGGQVQIPAEELLARPAALLEALGRREGLAINCIPSFWETLLEVMESGEVALPSGRLVSLLLGGEPLPDELVRRTRLLLPEVEIRNLYGPTEATANASAAVVREGKPITLGHPVANAQLHVVGLGLELQPVGVPGELCIGGDG